MSALFDAENKHASSLFERIQGKGSGSSQRAKIETLLSSIRQNLKLMLNTRPFACQSSPYIGIPDLNDAVLTGVDFKSYLEKVIADCITTYEPRINNVCVYFTENDIDMLSLQFNIVAFITLDNQKQKVEFNVQLDNNRQYQLKQS